MIYSRHCTVTLADRIFWPEEPDLVRLAARLNATIVPFSGIGGDESFSIALDSQVSLS